MSRKAPAEWEKQKKQKKQKNKQKGNKMRKLTAGIFATILTVVGISAANAEIASKTYVQTRPDETTITHNTTSDKFEVKDGGITAPKLNQMGATNGQVLKWDGTNSTWAPATDENTEFELGAGSHTTVGTDGKSVDVTVDGVIASGNTGIVSGGTVYTAIDNMDAASVGQNGSYIKTVSEANGVVTATAQAYDTTISSSSTDDNAPTSKAVYDYVDASAFELGAGSHTTVGTDGKSVDVTVDGVIASGDTGIVSGGTVYTAIDNMDAASVGASGSYIKTVSEANGVVTATAQAYDTTISSSSTNDNAPTSLAVYNAINTATTDEFSAGDGVYALTARVMNNKTTYHWELITGRTVNATDNTGAPTDAYAPAQQGGGQ